MIIDFHTHTFPSGKSKRIVDGLAKVSRTIHFTDGSLEDLKISMEKAGVDYSVNLPVMTSPEQVEKVNTSLIASLESMRQDGVFTFGGMHPDYIEYKKEIKRLADAGIKGIKLHPTYQKADLNDIRFMNIIDAASEAGLATIIHAGWDIGIYDHDYASVKQILDIENHVHPDKFILAHFGGWLNWKDVENYLTGGPFFFDTAFSVGPLRQNPDCDEPHFGEKNLDIEDFLRITRKHGVDKVLFATDSPWMDQTEYVQIFNEMPLTDSEREQIMHLNAEKILEI